MWDSSGICCQTTVITYSEGQGSGERGHYVNRCLLYGTLSIYDSVVAILEMSKRLLTIVPSLQFKYSQLWEKRQAFWKHERPT